MPAFVAITKHSVGKGTTFSAPGYFSSSKRTKKYSATVQADPFGDWIGNWVTAFLGTATDTFQDNNVSQTSVYTWTATNRSTHFTDSTGTDTTTTNIVENYGSVTGVPDTDVAELGWLGGSGGVGAYPPVLIYHYYARGIRYEWDYGWFGSATAQVGANTDMKLYTGGKARVSRKSLIHITGNAASYGRPPDGPWLHTPITQVDPTQIQVLGWCLFGRQQFDPNGDLYLALPDNAVKDLNMRVRGAKHYDARASATRHKLVHETLYPALTEPDLARTQLGVGEYVNCGFEPGNFPTNAVWTTSSGSLDTSVENWVWYTAPSNAGSATLTVDVAGTAKFKIKFKIKEPSEIDEARTYKVAEYTNYFYGPGISGAGIYLRVYVAPTDVSFYRVECIEVGEHATDVEGYYDLYYKQKPEWPTNLSHITRGADKWFEINADNSWQHNGLDDGFDWDRAFWGRDGQVTGGGWSPGGKFTWNIPGKWRIAGTGTGTEFSSWKQKCVLGSDGTMTITKFGKTVTRHPSSP